MNGLPFTVDKLRLQTKWGGLPASKSFRCGLCGHTFAEGDTCRFVWMNTPAISAMGSRLGNFLVCVSCDGDDVIEKRLAWEREATQRFWELMLPW